MTCGLLIGQNGLTFTHNNELLWRTIRAQNAPQKRHNNREKEGIWRRSFTKIAILKHIHSLLFFT